MTHNDTGSCECSLSLIGYLMRVPSREVRLQLAKTLLSLYNRTQKIKEVQDHKPASSKYNMMMVERSDVAETLVKVSLQTLVSSPTQISILSFFGIKWLHFSWCLFDH